MVDTVINNFNKEETDLLQLWANYPNTVAGIGSQFVLYSPAVVSKFEVKMRKNETTWTQVTGSIRARLYTSHTAKFRDLDDYADTLIAESTNAVDVDDLTNYGATVTFLFADVSLAAGVYFICLYSTDYVRNDSSVFALATYPAASIIGYVTFWWGDESRWGSYREWD